MQIIAFILALCFAPLASAFDPIGGAPKFYNSTGSKQVKPTGGRLQSVQAYSGTSSVQFFDDEDGTCDENALTGTLTLTADAPPQQLAYDMAYGICMLVTGSSPEVTVVIR
ncbi:MAG TPA: hypothetical protein PJ986_04580 [Gammaproteobacteria bacterium]|nr:hypothetical protein [Gammaproteobacteria bacterium]